MMGEKFKLFYGFAVLVIVFTISINVSAFAEKNIEVELEVNDAVETALSDNPSLSEMKSRYRAFAEIPSQAGSLPDPTINLNVMNLPTSNFSTSQEPMTQRQIGFSQAFPFPGKLALKKKASKYEAAAAANDVDEVRLQLARGVKSTWWQVYFLDRSLEIVNKNLGLLRKFIKIAQTKYKVGKGLQQDVLLAQLELSKLLDQKIQLSSLRINKAAELNTLMGREANIAIKLPENVLLRLPNIMSTSALFEEARMSKPTLLRNRNFIKAARARHKLARKGYYPDFKVGMNYGARSDGVSAAGTAIDREDFASITFSLSVPLYARTKQTREIYQRQHEFSQSEFAKKDTYNSILSDITRASSEYNRARDQFSLFKTGILPQARQTVKSMLSGYKVSQVDFLNLVKSQITLFNYEMKYWKALAEANQSLASIEASVGTENIYKTVVKRSTKKQKKLNKK